MRSHLNINQKAVVAGFEVKEMTNVYLGLPVEDDAGKRINRNIIKKGARIPAYRTKEVYIHDKIIHAQLNTMKIGYSLPQIPYEWKITEAETDETDISNVKIVWRKNTYWPKLNSSTISPYLHNENSFASFLKRWIVIKVRYTIDSNQIFHVKVRHPESNTILVDEKIDMKKGSLSVKGNKKDSIDKFIID